MGPFDDLTAAQRQQIREAHAARKVTGQRPDHLWPCGCLINDGGAHRRSCPEYETVEDRDGTGRVVRWWRPRRADR